jgi:hypothetical protein
MRFSHGEPMTIRIAYVINDLAVRRVQALITFHRDGVLDVCRLFAASLDVAVDGQRSGYIIASIPRLMLGEGRYTISLGITEPNYYDNQQVLFYSINPGMFDCRARFFEIEVVGGGIVAVGTGVVADALWTVAAAGESEREKTTAAEYGL